MRKINAQLVAETLNELMTNLEAFADHFADLATTAEQRDLVELFHTFLDERIQTIFPSGERTERLVFASEAEIFQATHGHESLSDLFNEIRADEAAKKEDAHWFGKGAFQKILDGDPTSPATEVGKDKGIER